MIVRIPPSVDKPTLVHGDCIDVLRALPDASVDCVVTDPPAGIGFMAKAWDSFARYEPRTARGRDVAPLLDALGLAAWERGFVTFLVDVWTEVNRVLKPGGFVCAWALPKTADLAGLAMRLVGWTVHESLLHLFGQGMTKAGDLGKKIDKMHGAEREVVETIEDRWAGKGVSLSRANERPRESVDITAPATDDAKRWTDWSSQLAPGHEQWLLGRKPTRLSYAKQVLEHGCGAFNIGACRVPRGEGVQANAGSIGESRHCYGDSVNGYTKGDGYHLRTDGKGSWPRNVVLTAGGEGCPVEGLDAQSGVMTSGTGAVRRATASGHQGEVYGATSQPEGTPQLSHGDTGGASRYFTRFEDRVRYCAKASDRRAGLRSDIENKHPTHKHPDLMRWLVRLLAATAENTGGEPAVVLDCFMGSGVTGVACVAEGVRFIGIERDPITVRSIHEPGSTASSELWRVDLRVHGVGASRCSSAAAETASAVCLGSVECCDVIVPDEPMSFQVASARIMAAIGSPEEAAKANVVAPVGAQLGLL